RFPVGLELLQVGLEGAGLLLIRRAGRRPGDLLRVLTFLVLRLGLLVERFGGRVPGFGCVTGKRGLAVAGLGKGRERADGNQEVGEMSDAGHETTPGIGGAKTMAPPTNQGASYSNRWANGRLGGRPGRWVTLGTHPGSAPEAGRDFWWTGRRSAPGAHRAGPVRHPHWSRSPGRVTTRPGSPAPPRGWAAA